MPSVGVGVSITRSSRLQRSRPGSNAIDGHDHYRDDREEFRDSAGKYFKVVATQYTGDKAQLRVRP